MSRLFVSLLAVFLFLAAAGAEPPFLEVAHQGPVWAVAWAPDGKALAAAGQDGNVHVIAVPSGKEITRFAALGPVKGLVFAPDGKTVAVKVADALRIHDAATGQTRQQLPPGMKGYHGAHLAFTADGGSVVAAGVGERVFWPFSKGGASGSRMGNPPPDGFAAVSLDGDRIAWGQPATGQVILDAPNGRNHQVLRIGKAHAIAFGLNARTLASGNADKLVHLWDVSSGQELLRFEGMQAVPSRVVFSANGKTIAALASGGLAIHVWEVESGRPRRQVTALPAPVLDLALSPDGKFLATAGSDFKTRVWNVAIRELERPKNPVALAKQEMERLWEDLASTDRARAEAAYRALAAAGNHAVPFLEERLRHVAIPKVEDARVEQLVSQLDARNFTVRQKATTELAKYGEMAEAPLRKLLASRPSAEAERRATMLLDKLKEPVLSPERARALEGIELLEWLRTPEARRVLEGIARDGLIPRLRGEATEALQRLGSAPQG
ncbi:MAG TPA: hypothetical protein VEL76_01130 [Gemmataceae bacterium]|nr:hypothetical protein [Gemmataceae bacterium]